MGRRLEYKATGAATAAESGVVEVDEATGIVEAIVSVTGVVDADNDLIEPGAYAASLKARTPKGIFHHKWDKWVAKTLDIAELRPGDPRLPTTTRAGDPWPAGAGGLWVKAQFNLATNTGREAFENVRFFADETEWSIGYKVKPGHARKTPDGVRRIKQLDLYEYSPVLFGAAPLSGTLSVKAEGGDDEDDDEPEDLGPETGEGGEPDDGDADELHQAVEAAIASDETPPDGVIPEDAAPGGEPLTDDGTEPGEVSLFDPVEDAEADTPAIGPGTEPGEVSLFDLVEDDETGVGQAKDGGGDDLETKAGLPGVADTPSDERNVRRLKRWYTHGEGAIKIRWGQDGDFLRCVRIASEHMDPERAKGFCANRHKEALGVWPGREGGKKDAYDPGLETGPDAGHLDPGPDASETKAIRIPGTLEELQGRIRAAVEEQFGSDPGPGGEYKWVCIEGTWPDRVIVTVEHGPSGLRRDSYAVPYALTPVGDVMLGEPQPVTITVTPAVTPMAVAAKADSIIRLAAALGAELGVGGLEVKAGRVLSAVNEERLRVAAERLIEVLRAAGIDITGPGGSEPPEGPPGALDVAEGKVLLNADLLRRARELRGFARQLPD